MRKSAWLLVVALAVPACSAGESESASVDRDTLTRRQKDSITAESPLPGAGAVGHALDAEDAAARRNARMDSALNH